MQIVIMASGTRGDVQPVIALGQALRDSGHRVRLIAGSNFAGWIELHGLDFYPTFDMEAVMQSDLGLQWVEGKSQLDQLRAMRALVESLSDPIITDMTNGTEGADLILCGFVTSPFAQSIGEKRGVPTVMTALQPYVASRHGSASLSPVLPHNRSRLNLWMGRMVERMSWSVAAKTTNAMRAHLGIPVHTARSYLAASRKMPALYGISPSVVPPIENPNVHTTGYWFLDEPFTPPDDLMRFLDAGDPPIYIGFGSMSSSNPGRTLDITAESLARIGQRGIVARGWSGLQAHEMPKHLYLAGSTPHSWLFPRMAAVVHHGGAGTTAAGLRAGKASLIVPHFADQPFWARRLDELKVSAKPLERAKLTVDSLTERLNQLVTDRALQDRAAAMGERIRAERGIENAVAWLNEFISTQT